MDKLDLKKKLTFETIDDRILYMIRNDYCLDGAELWHIYDNMTYKNVLGLLSPTYKRLYKSILYLLNKLHGDEYYALVEVLNSDFKYCPNWNVNMSASEAEVGSWTYTCKNHETGRYLISLAEGMSGKEKNNSLNKLKELCDKGRSGKE